MFPDRNLLVRAGSHFQVERQVMVVLIYLVEHVNEVVPRDELLENLWTESFPNSNGLTQCISKLRTAFGDSPKKAARIETIRKVGYRLIGPIELADKTNAEEATKSGATRQGSRPHKQVNPVYLPIVLHVLIGSIFLAIMFANLEETPCSQCSGDLQDQTEIDTWKEDPFDDFFTSFMTEAESTAEAGVRRHY